MDFKKIKIIKNCPPKEIMDYNPIDITQYIGNIYKVAKIYRNGDIEIWIEADECMSLFNGEYEIVE
jgi:hypothetical protein